MVFPTFFNLNLNLAIRSSWFEPRKHIKKQGHHSAVYSKVHIVKSMVFPVFMYRCERWTIKKTECLRTEAFELWCWRRLLRVPCTARKLSQSTLKEFKPQFSLKGLILKLKLQYFQAPGPKSQLTGNDSDAGIYWGQEKKWAVAEDERVRQHLWFNGQGFEPAVGDSEGQTSLVCCSLWGHRVRHDWATELTYHF